MRLTPTYEEERSLFSIPSRLGATSVLNTQSVRFREQRHLSFTPTFRLGPGSLYSPEPFQWFFLMLTQKEFLTCLLILTRALIHSYMGNTQPRTYAEEYEMFEAVWLGVALREKPLKWLA